MPVPYSVLQKYSTTISFTFLTPLSAPVPSYGVLGAYVFPVLEVHETKRVPRLAPSACHRHSPAGLADASAPQRVVHERNGAKLRGVPDDKSNVRWWQDFVDCCVLPGTILFNSASTPSTAIVGVTHVAPPKPQCYMVECDSIVGVVALSSLQCRFVEVPSL